MRVYFVFILSWLMVFFSSCSSVDDSKTLKEISNETEIHIPKCASIESSTLSLLKQKKESNTAIVSNDTDSPQMRFDGANPLVLQQGETYKRECAIAIDAQDGQVDVYIKDDSVDTSKSGEYTILFSAVDSVGNIAELRRIVRVLPTMPILTLNGDETITLKQNQTYQELGATAKDNLDQTIEVKISGTVDTNTIGSYTLTYTATDKNNNSASIIRTVNVTSLPLTIHTPYEGVSVILHDATKQRHAIATKTTNKDGNVTFMDSDYNLSFAENNLSFSIVVAPNDPISPQEIFDTQRNTIIQDAYTNCTYYSDSNITECKSANWCDLSLKNEIPVWLFDVAKAYLSYGDSSEITKAIDQNADTLISPQELYDAKITYGLDKNKDGVLTRNEIASDENMHILTFINVPAHSYTFTREQITKEIRYEDNYCQNRSLLTLTNASEVSRFEVYGSAFGGNDAKSQNEVNTTLYPTHTDKYGNFDYLVNIYPVDGSRFVKPLLDISPKQEKMTININELNTPLFTDVEFIQDSNDTLLELVLTHHGVVLEPIDSIRSANALSNNNSNSINRSVYSDSSLYYLLKGSRYNDHFTFTHYDYYGDGNLSKLYSASDYPMLDVTVFFDKNGTIQFGGNEKDKLQLIIINARFHTEGEEGIDIGVYRFHDTSSITSLEYINMFPSKIKTVLTTIFVKHAKEIGYEVFAFEFKDFNLLDTITQLLPINLFYDEQQQPIFLKYRSIRVDWYNAGGL